VCVLISHFIFFFFYRQRLISRASRIEIQNLYEKVREEKKRYKFNYEEIMEEIQQIQEQEDNTPVPVSSGTTKVRTHAVRV